MAGISWVLISGIARKGPVDVEMSAHPYESFRSANLAAKCEDPTSDDVYSIGGLYYNGSFESETVSNEVWYSSDAMRWSMRTPKSFAPPRWLAGCDVDYSGRVFVIGGYGQETPGGSTSQLQDVWSSSNKGVAWTRVTSRAAFSARAWHEVQITHSDYYNKDLIYVTGGYNAATTSRLNDVWVSSNGGSQWTLVTARAAWAARGSHRVVFTNAGAMLLMGGSMGGNGVNSLNDIWLSVNGGTRFTACRLPPDNTFIRDAQAVALTGDERLMVGNGVRLQSTIPQEYTDLWLSDMSLSNTATLARMCSATIDRDNGIGLRVSSWTPYSNSSVPDDDPGADSGSTGVSGGSSSSSVPIIIGVTLGCVMLLAVAFWLYRTHQQTGSWNPFGASGQRRTVGAVDSTSLVSLTSDDGNSHMSAL